MGKRKDSGHGAAGPRRTVLGALLVRARGGALPERAGYRPHPARPHAAPSASVGYGETGQGAGNVNVPLGVAVSESTGDVYVVDSANNRVDRFDAEGHFIEAWGWGVKTGGKALETCTTTCLKGLAGHGKGQLEEAEGIAVDNSTSASDPSKGDVYVEVNTSEEYGAIDKFSPDGSLLLQITGTKIEKGAERRTVRRTPRHRGRTERGPSRLRRRRSLPPGRQRKKTCSCR